MAKPNFENLQVYQLAERLADEIWNIVGRWEEFAKDTVVDTPTALSRGTVN